MHEQRFNAHKLNFVASGTQTISVAANQHIQIFQVDVSVDADTSFDMKIGSSELISGRLRETSLPVQLFFYDFGMGRGTGVKGDNFTLTLGTSGVAYVTYILYEDH